MVDSVPVLGAAWGVGASNAGTALGPVILRDSELLHALPFDLDWQPLIYAKQCEPHLAAMDSISNACEQLAHQSLSLAENNEFFVSLGGDHSCAVGTWSGVAHAKAAEGPIGLIWIDAHLDAHTPKTSDTGNIHGMPLAALLGFGDARLTDILSANPKLLPEHVCHIGARSFEAGEQQLLEKLGVQIYYMDAVQEQGFDAIFKAAYKKVTANTAGFGITLCIDALEPSAAPGVGTPETGGINIDELLATFKTVAHDPELLALEIAEFNPNLDQDQKTEKIIQAVLATFSTQ